MKSLTMLSLLSLASIFGCKTTTTAPELTGDLRGTVALYDSHGNPVSDKSGVLVQAEGTSNSAISDTSGIWIIHNLPTRTYSLSFSKAGYGTKKNTSFSFVGGGTVDYDHTESKMYLAEPVSFSITLDTALAPSPSYNGKVGRISGHILNAYLSDSNNIEIDVWISTSPDVDAFGKGAIGIIKCANDYQTILENQAIV